MSKIESFSRAFALGLPAITAAAFAGVLLAPAAQAQVTNINKPNATGVSLNTTNSFNVPTTGLVLNNTNGSYSCSAGTPCTTPKLGFSVTSTSYSNPTTATLILEQVTGAGATSSSLQGVLEIFGGKADFILANPLGITCDGCGFYNTPRVTLTTGTPTDSTGLNYTVTSNKAVTVGNVDLKGLSYFDIIADTIKSQGGVIQDSSDSTPNHSSTTTNVRMFAGDGSFTYDQSTSANLAPTLTGGGGIDLSQLGGAYAGQITLVSTGSGVGINTPSSMTAAYGGINLTANGKIVFNNATAQGAISAKSTATTGSSGITVNNGSQVQAQGAQGSVSFVTTTSGDIQLGGSVTAQTTLALQAAGAVTVGSTASSGTGTSISAGTFVTNNGTISSSGASPAGSSIVAGTNFTNNGTVSFLNDAISISATTGDLTNAGLISSQTLKLAAAKTLTNAGNVSAQSGGLTLSAAQALNTGSLNAANGTVTATITASAGMGDGSFDNKGTIGIDPSTSLTSASNTTLTAGSFSNSGKVASNGKTSVTTTLGGLTNSGSISGQSLNANAAGTLDNQASGTLSSGADMTLSANTLTNEGSVNAGTTLKVNTSGGLTNTGQMTFQGDSTFNVGGTLTNGIAPSIPTNATIHAGGTLTVNAGAVQNFGGVDILMPRGELSGLYLVINAGNVENQANLFAGQNITINSTGTVENALGWIKAGNYISVTAAGNFNNVAGLLQGNGMNFNAQTMENVVLVRLDDDQLLPKKLGHVLRPITSQSVAQAVAGWDKSVLVKFGTVDNKALDTLRLQLGDPFLMQQKQQQQGKGAGNFPQPGQGASTKHTDAAPGARAAAF